MQEEPKENLYKLVNEPPNVKYSTQTQTNQLAQTNMSQLRGIYNYYCVEKNINNIKQQRRRRIHLFSLSTFFPPVPVAQLSADHLCVLLGPVVVTHRPPVAVVEDLHPTLPGTVSTHQAHHSV